MSGFEPRISGVGSDRSINCTTTISRILVLFARLKYPVVVELIVHD